MMTTNSGRVPAMPKLSDNPETLRRQVAVFLFGHYREMATSYKQGTPTLAPGWPALVLTGQDGPLTRDELDGLPLAQVLPLIQQRMRADGFPV
jgi:hypothetical protein